MISVRLNRGRHTYTAFMGAFEKGVYMMRATIVVGHIVLKEQHLLVSPVFWHKVNLIDAAGDKMVGLYFRSDNLYLAAFQNKYGLFCFKSKEARLPGTPTALSFTGDYDHTRYLAQYRDRYVDDTTLKPSLAFYVIGDAVTQHIAFTLWRSLSKI